MTTISKRTRNVIRGAILLALVTGWFAAPRVFRHWVEPTALAAPMTFVVNTDFDVDDGSCTAAPAGCSLREAIKAANANPGTDTIHFNIPGAGVKTLHLEADNLPVINSPLIIDGYTQGIAHPNTLAVGNDAVLLIELDGSSVTKLNNLNSIGLHITAGGSTVRGMVINRFLDGIFLSGGDGNVIEGNFIGINPTGNAAFPGVFFTGVSVTSANNTIGGTTAAARNVISGVSRGVTMYFSGTTGNQVQNNYIGTDSSGTLPLGNTLGGVEVFDAPNNTIGGTLAMSGNLIAFNGTQGVLLEQAAIGTAVLGNSIHSNSALGIDLAKDNVTSNDFGDSDTGPNNLQNFPVLTAATSAPANTTVQGTLNSTPNSGFRIEVFSSPSCDQSGNGEGKKLVDSKNVVTNASGDASFTSLFSTALLDGPYITSTATDSLNNTSEFSKCIPATDSTFVVNSTVDTDDGSCTAAPGGCTLREAMTAANTSPLLSVINFNIPGSGLQTISLQSALPIITTPVIIDGYTQPGATPNTMIDGENAVLLIEINGANAGVNNGLLFGSGSNTVRGLIINRFTLSAIHFDSGAGNVVVGNFIGTDSFGNANLGNDTGVSVSSPINRIGGLTPADRNVISGNGAGVVILKPEAQGNVIWGNYIGTNASGMSPVGHSGGNSTAVQINLQASHNSIGGAVSAARNVISDHTFGVVLNTGASHNLVRGNFIGTDRTGVNAIGNLTAGVAITLALPEANNNIIGGYSPEEANVIAFNGGDGVFINFGQRNAILGNSIHSNGELGIDLAPNGVTPNDGPGDPDTGPNRLQNFPVLNSATLNGSSLEVEGTLVAFPNVDYNVQFFASTSCDPSGNGEGEKALSGIVVTPDANGSITFTSSLTASAGGQYITAIATDPDGNTSEFSNCVQAPFASNLQFGTPSLSNVEDCHEVTFTVSRMGDTSTPASVDYASQSGTASDRTDFTTALGTLHFAPGESALSFSVLITEDSFVEGTETATLTLSNAVGAGLGSPATATLQITDDQPEQSNNPVDVAEQFVCQHYQDFLNREHDVAGLNFWTNEIESCGADAECRAVKRINVSAAFFLSIEFQETGGDVIRTQRAAFGKKSDMAASRLTYPQFLRDARQVGKGVIVNEPGWEQTLEDNKQAYAEQVVTSSQFVALYPLNQTADTYVDALFASAGVVPTASERQEAINAFGGGGVAGRTAALRKVADSSTLRAAEFRPAFVLMQYFGYLRRNPTDPPDSNDNGYQFWFAKLNAFNGDYVKAEMVKAFIVSTEYRSRFGAP